MCVYVVNETNWNRHLTACNVVKLKSSKTVTNILSFMAKKRTIDEVHQSLPNKDILNSNILDSTSNYSCTTFSQITVSNAGDSINTTEALNDSIPSPKLSCSITNIVKASNNICPSEIQQTSDKSDTGNDIHSSLRTCSVIPLEQTELIEEQTPNTLDTGLGYSLELNNCNDNTDLKLPIDNDPAVLSKIVKFSYNLKKQVLNKGPSQPDYKSMPNIHFPITNGRHFRPEWFIKTMSDGTSVKRDWMSYSLSEDKVYCILCIISGEKNSWTTNGFNSWKKATLKLISHETSFKHIEVCLKLKLIDNCLPLVPALEGSNKTMVATNRFIVNQLVDITV